MLSEVFIIAKVNQEIITNIDIDFEKKYLVSLNPNLNKLDENRITEYAKNSLINEKIKKIEIEKNFEIIPNEILLSNVLNKRREEIIVSLDQQINDKKIIEFNNFISTYHQKQPNIKEKLNQQPIKRC